MEGIKRLAKMLEGQKDKYLIIIVNHLMQHTELDKAFLNEEKNLKDMAEYIKREAKKQAIDGVAVIEDAIVFQWSIDYFVKSNEELKIAKSINKKTDIKEVKSKESDDEFGSIFDPGEGKREISTEEVKETKKEEIEQISLFGI